MSDELERLNKLHDDGGLSDDEFAQAKRKLLRPARDNSSEPASPDPVRRENDLAGNFAFQMAMILMVVIIVALALISLGPHSHPWHWYH